MLVAFASVSVVAHLVAAIKTAAVRPQWWRFWAGYCGVAAAFYGVMVWSYVGLAAGTRTPDAHMALVTMVGPPLLAHPAVLLVGGMLQQSLQLRDVRGRTAVGDDG